MTALSGPLPPKKRETEREPESPEGGDLSDQVGLDQLIESLDLVLALEARPVSAWTKREALAAARILAREHGRQQPGLLTPNYGCAKLKWDMSQSLVNRLLKPHPTAGAPERIQSQQVEVFRTLVEGARERGEDVAELARRIYKKKRIRDFIAVFFELNWRGRLENSFVISFQNKWRSVRRKLMKNQ